jgi:hypothetical protein
MSKKTENTKKLDWDYPRKNIQQTTLSTISQKLKIQRLLPPNKPKTKGNRYKVELRWILPKPPRLNEMSRKDLAKTQLCP